MLLPAPVAYILSILALLGSIHAAALAQGQPELLLSQDNATHWIKASSRRKLQPIQPVSGSFTSITLRLELCGAEPRWPHDEVYSTILGGARSLRDYYQQCSFGRLRVSPDQSQNYVVPQTIPISRSCGQLSCGSSGAGLLNGLNALAEEAESYASERLGIDMSQYSIKIFLLPPGAPRCANVRLAYIGCWEPGHVSNRCRTWLTALDLPAVAHETGHNLGLGHAGTRGNDYGDRLTPMGSTGGFYCPNAYHSFKLGWSSPLMQLSSDEIESDTWRKASLPPRAAEPDNFVLLSDSRGSDNDLFVSFLAPAGWERGNHGPDMNKVLIHTQNDGDNQKSVCLGQLDVGDRLKVPGSGWVVYVSDVSGDHAAVQFCYARTVSDCSSPSDGKNDRPHLSVFEIPETASDVGDNQEATTDDDSSQAYTASARRSESSVPKRSSRPEGAPPSLERSSRPEGSRPIFGRSSNRKSRSGKRPVHKCLDKPRCGDRRCDSWAGENCRTCPSDCARVTNPKTGRSHCCGGRVPLAPDGSAQAAGQGCRVAGNEDLCEPRALTCAMRCRRLSS